MINKSNNVLFIFLVLLLTLFISGCVPIVGTGQPDNNYSPEKLSRNSHIGQTFISRHAGLEGVDIYLIPQNQGSGKVDLFLRSSSDDVDPIFYTTLSLSDIQEAKYYRFTIPTQSDSYLRNYFLDIRFDDPGLILVGTSGPKAYEDGSLYVNNNPVEKQLAFRLVYSFPHLLVGILRQAGLWLLWCLAAIIFFILPGYIILEISFTNSDRVGFWDKVSLGGAISLSVYIFIFLWTGFLGVFIGSSIVWLVIITTVLIKFGWRDKKQTFSAIHISLKKSDLWIDFLIIIVICLISALRLYVIRPYEYPMGSDSIQHTAITQLFLNQNGMFSNWLPYAPYQSFSVQYGFSAGAAVWSWVFGYNSAFSVFTFGQILNIISILPLYALGKKLSGDNPWAGLSALILSGLFSVYPAFFVNWGRYPQLAGQTILPAAIWLTLVILENKKLSLAQVIVAGLLVLGMVLSYYRMAFFFIAIVFPMFVIWGIQNCKLNLKLWMDKAKYLGFIGMIALVMIFPWYFHMAGGAISNAAEEGADLQSFSLILNDFKILFTDYYPQWRVFWFLSGIGLCFAVIKRFWVLLSLVIFLIVLFVLRIGSLLNIPGTYTLESVSINNFLYIPLSILSGAFIGWMLQQFYKRPQHYLLNRILLSGVVILICIYGVWSQRGILIPGLHNFVTRPDERAMKWIKENTSADSLFLTNGFRFRNTSALAGDAGYWLPLLTGRRNTLPPQYALVFEQPITPEYTQNSIDLIHLLESSPPDSPQILRKLCDWGVNYIYIGQKYDMYTHVLSPEKFQNENYFALIYWKDRVKIYQFLQDTCQ